MFLRVALDQRDLGVAAAGEAQVGERLLVDGEEAHRGPVLRRHVGDQGPIGHFHALDGGPEVLDELVDHAFLAEDLRDREHQVGGRGAGRKFAAELEADDLGGEHVERLAEHDGLGLDAADAPAQHAQAVDHRGMAVGADQRIGKRDRPGVVFAQEHALGQVLEVDLVYDADGRRHDAEVLKGLLAPAEELVALAVRAGIRSPRCGPSSPARRKSRPAPSGRSPGRPAPGG